MCWLLAVARELAGPDDLLRPRDRAPIVWVSAQAWYCLFCPTPTAPAGFLPATTVVWMGANTDGPHGRCRDCGQKYALAATYKPGHVPSPEEQGWR
jgi:hypothetical protein